MFKSNTMESRSMLLILLSLAIGFSSGMAGSVYRLVLAYEPIMSWWFKFGARYEKKWFFAPIWGCQLCISGQISLWSFVFIEMLPIISTQNTQISTLHTLLISLPQTLASLIFGLIVSICAAISTAKIITPFLNK